MSPLSQSTDAVSAAPGLGPAAKPEQWFHDEVHPHEDALRGYLRRQFPSVDADDVVQESYLRLLKARAQGGIASTRAYVFAIARNTALTLFHRRRIYSPVALDELPEWRVLDGTHDVAGRVDHQLRLELAVAAIDQLPGRCREIFRMAVLDRLSAAEIAQRTGLGEKTVYTQIAIGTRKCSDYLREKGERL